MFPVLELISSRVPSELSGQCRPHHIRWGQLALMGLAERASQPGCILLTGSATTVQCAEAHLTSMIANYNHGRATNLGKRFVLLPGKRKNVQFVLRLNKTVSCDLSWILVTYTWYPMSLPATVSYRCVRRSALFHPTGKTEAVLLLTVDDQAQSTFVALCLQGSPPQCGNSDFVLRRTWQWKVVQLLKRWEHGSQNKWANSGKCSLEWKYELQLVGSNNN